MTRRTETRQIRLAQCRKIFQQKAESGLTAKEFCAINNISKDAYYYWLHIPVKLHDLSDLNCTCIPEQTA